MKPADKKGTSDEMFSIISVPACPLFITEAKITPQIIVLENGLENHHEI